MFTLLMETMFTLLMEKKISLSELISQCMGNDLTIIDFCQIFFNVMFKI